MSVDAMGSAVSAGVEDDTESLAWLQGLLRSAMEGVMTAEGDPIRKANSLARLAGLYMKTCQVTELKQAQKQLAARVAALEEALAGLQAEADEPLPGEAGSTGAGGAYQRLAPCRAQTPARSAGEPALMALASGAGAGGSTRGDPG